MSNFSDNKHLPGSIIGDNIGCSKVPMNENGECETSNGRLLKKYISVNAAPSDITDPLCTAGDVEDFSAVNKCTRDKKIVTAGLFIANIGMGLAMGVMGPTLLELQRLSSSSISQAALLFTWSAVGRILGSLLSTCTLQKCSQVLQIAVTFAVMSTAHLAVPWCSDYAVLSGVVALIGFCTGFYGAVISATWFLLWGAKARSFIHASTFAVSCGCFIAPLLAKPFLKATSNNNITVIITDVMMEIEALAAGEFDAVGLVRPAWNNESSRMIQSVENASNSAHYDVTNHRIPPIVFIYVIIASYLALTVSFFAYLFVRHGCKATSSLPTTSKLPRSAKHASIPKARWQIIAAFALSMFCSCGLEVAYGGLLMAFVVDYLGWDHDQGALVTFAFWLTLSLGRGGGIFLIRVVSPSKIILFNGTLTLLSLVLLAVGLRVHNMVVWISSCLLGVATSSNVANLLSMAYEHHSISGWGSSLVMTGGYVGMLPVPALTGMLIQHVHPMCFVYTLLGISVIFICLYPAITCTPSPVILLDVCVDSEELSE